MKIDLPLTDEELGIIQVALATRKHTITKKAEQDKIEALAKKVFDYRELFNKCSEKAFTK